MLMLKLGEDEQYNSMNNTLEKKDFKKFENFFTTRISGQKPC